MSCLSIDAIQKIQYLKPPSLQDNSNDKTSIQDMCDTRSTPLKFQKMRMLPRKSIRKETLQGRFQRKLQNIPKIIELPHAASLNLSEISTLSDKLFAPAQDVRRRSFCKKRDTVEGIEKRKMSNAKKSKILMFVDPESLPEMQSPRQYGKYWVRKFDGNMSETKVEHARILNEEQDKKKFSFRDAIFLSTNTTPRMSRKPSHRSTVSTPWEITEEAQSFTRERGRTISGLEKLSEWHQSKGETNFLDYELLSVRSEDKETDSLKQESVESTMLSTQNDEMNRSSSFLQIPLINQGGASPRVGKASLFRSTSKLLPDSPKVVKKQSSTENYPQVRLSSLFLQDMKKIVTYSPAFRRSQSKFSDSDKSCRSKVSQASQLPTITKHNKPNIVSNPTKHKKRMKRLIKIAQICNLNINVVKEEVLRYEGEKSSIKLANYLEKEIRKRANLFSSEVRYQMHILDKLKREWQNEEFENDSEVSKASTFSSTSWDSDSSSISSRLFTQ